MAPVVATQAAAAAPPLKTVPPKTVRTGRGSGRQATPAFENCPDEPLSYSDQGLNNRREKKFWSRRKKHPNSGEVRRSDACAQCALPNHGLLHHIINHHYHHHYHYQQQHHDARVCGPAACNHGTKARVRTKCRARCESSPLRTCITTTTTITTTTNNNNNNQAAAVQPQSTLVSAAQAPATTGPTSAAAPSATPNVSLLSHLLIIHPRWIRLYMCACIRVCMCVHA